MLISHNYFST
jgi:hypothetical protein